MQDLREWDRKPNRMKSKTKGGIKNEGKSN